MSRMWDGFEAQRVIDRPHLRAALDRAVECRLTLIVAQAGAGKTTLLRQWAASRPDLDVVVLDVDESDDDPGHFARRLISALAVVYPGLRRLSRSIVADGDGLSPDLFTALASELESLPEVVVVFDNLHRLSNLRLISDLGRLVRHTPRNVHCVLSTRVDPPMSLSSHRLNDELLELRRDDLAFSIDEADTMLQRLIGAPLPHEQVRVLWDRTEGWAAGLQLAALNLRQHTDPGSFIADFGGSDRLVADYLGEEVLASLSPERRRILLELSALDDMCAGLVRATTTAADAQSVLRDLEAESMFLVPLDDHGEWYRFHHLFRELLRSRLRAESPSDELRIITTAADWNFASGRVKNAMEYLLRAQARDGALEAMLEVVDEPETTDGARSLALSGSGAVGTVGQVTLPEHIGEDVLSGVRAVLSGRSTAPLAVTARAASPSRWARRSHRGLGFVAAQVLWRARPESSPEAARRRLREIEARCLRKPLGALTRRDASDLAQALVSGGRALFLAGDVVEARGWLTRALVTAGPDVVEHIAASSALSLVEAWSGNVDEANALVAETLTTARNAGMLSLPSIADASLASVLTALEEPAAAEEPDPRDDPWHTASAWDEGTLVTTSRGATTTVAGLSPTMLFDRAVASFEADDVHGARNIVEHWDRLVPAFEPLAIVQHHILSAWLADRDGAPDEGRRHLTEAVRVAEIHGLVDVFVRAGPAILDRIATVSGPQAAFGELIVARAGLGSTHADESVLLEPLTEREREILSYLPTRFSNVDLAQRFFVSVNTIKTHIAHIYRKLDVANRDAAIRRAREVGIL